MIKHIGNFNDRKTEGMTKISKVIRNIKSEKKIAHYHGNGIGTVFKSSLRFNPVPQIYSLYSNLDLDLKKRIDAIKRNKEIYGTKQSNMIKSVIASSLSKCIPFNLKRDLLSDFKRVIVPTQYLKDSLELKNCEVIPFGIDINKFKPIEKSNDKIVVSYIGSASSEKGFFETVNAFKQIDNPNIECRMYLPVIPKHFTFPDNVKLFGTLENIEEAYQNSHIVVMPHLTLTASVAMPLVLVEAMACECLVITTPLPHIQEVGGDNIMLCDLSNNILVDNINVAAYECEQGNLTNICKQARQHIIDKYSEDVMIERYKDLYERL